MSTIVEWAAALGTISAACGIIMRAITKDVVRDVLEVRKEIADNKLIAAKDTADLKHDFKNQISRIDGLEHLHIGTIERVVKLETSVQNFDKAIERIERGQDKLGQTITERFDTLAESIREIRTVAPRS